jgi:hypothetical protein
MLKWIIGVCMVFFIIRGVHGPFLPWRPRLHVPKWGEWNGPVEEGYVSFFGAGTKLFLRRFCYINGCYKTKEKEVVR